MKTYLYTFLLAIFISINISCEKEIVENLEEFLYGVWNQNETNPQNFPFYYAQGFEFNKDLTASPRYDSNKENKFITNDEYVGSWSYSETKKEITFTEEGSQFPKTYILERISDDEIKLTNPVTKQEYLYIRE